MVTVWAKYGMKADPVHWTYLKSISAMSPSEIENHIQASTIVANVIPDYVAETSEDLCNIIPTLLPDSSQYSF